MSEHDTFEQLAWKRMEQAYEGFLRSLWREELGCYVETQAAMLGKYHIYRNKHKNWDSGEDRHRALRMVDYYLDPEHFGPRDWTGHPAGVWMTVRLLCLAYRYRKELGMPDTKAEAIRSMLDKAIEAHLWTKGSSWHGNQEVYDFYLTDCWYAFRAFGEKKYWEWVLHFLEEIKQRYNRPRVDDVAGARQFRYLQRVPIAA